MPNNISSTLPGALVSLLAQRRNQERQGTTPQPQAASPAPKPAAVENAARFDFAEPASQAATAVPASISSSSASHAVPVSPAATVAQVGTAAMMRTAAMPAASVAAAMDKAMPLTRPEGAADNIRAEQGANPDDEAKARAWAIQSLTRENTLGMIDQIIRLADKPEPAEATVAASRDGAASGSEGAERRTLARA